MVMRRRKAPGGTELSLSPSSASVARSPSPDDAEEGGGDRLTDLPDALRCRILSLLPLKYAIRTGALSLRWNGLWRHRWPHPASLDLSPRTIAEDNFAAGVDRRLAARGRGLRMDAFVLSLPPFRRYDAELERWLEYAASCGVEDVRLVVLPPSEASSSQRRSRRVHRHVVSTVLFHSVSECSNLVRLTISGLHLTGPGSTPRRLPVLEVLTLHLSSVTDAGLRRIVAASPLLRTLDLQLCRKLRRITITANSRLTSLTIVECPRAMEIMISAPGLRSFKYVGKYLTNYCFDGTNRLEDVYMSTSSPDSLLFQSNWVTALSEISNIRVLTLCNISLQYIVISGENAGGGFLKLRNLRELHLQMGLMTDDNLMNIYGFFRLCKCDRLEKLVIKLPTAMRDPFVENFLSIPMEEPPEVDFKSLRAIKLKSFKGHKNEMKLVRFLLGKASLLETLMLITCNENMVEEYTKHRVGDSPEFLDFLQQQLSVFAKASVDAQIILREHDDNNFNPTHRGV
ncbi:hypothetical protein Cni_G24462 [Canna indica]|uniref:At1g61320/AtMIF1 LRR domain-containing protein n=1 Tax=Canna indica TaxID=4628 RepID=A0AAQ3QK46_9LILI|nr:hypothetical protein Cni_G24462 [Canna indica]